ncbi:phosphotransferase family protein [Mycolicibacterium mengxianglii]|uniref:phosphotransferase family protein n=1 Tax=Mycolicibacterium mengxianglii TaxID=2736649 RepID=UPI0018EED4E1|nr:phosphotransferase [Mycolicibacterium mengxianglii]
MTVTTQLRHLGLTLDGEVTTDPAPSMASPSWWGADSECLDVRSDSTSMFVKTMIGHAKAYVDIPQAFAAATEAGALGVGPVVLASDADTGMLVMENLTESAATATLDKFDDDAALERLIAVRTRVREMTATITRAATVFDDIRDLIALAEANKVGLPKDFDWMIRLVDMAEQRILASGFDTVPAHGDGNVSNVLLVEDGRTLLVDWDVAAVMDPLQDIGVLLAEVRPFDSSARSAFEIAWGSYDQSLFDRARVYGIVDCVRWGLIGAYADAARPGTLEYSKLSDWQFLRARAGLADVHFHDRLESL